MSKPTFLPPLTTLVCNLNAAFPRLRAAVSLFAALAFGALPARAAVAEAWVHRYSNVVTNADDQAFEVVRDAAGDIIVTGSNMRAMLAIKYSGANGTVIWQQNGPPNPSGLPYAIAVDGSGNVAVTRPFGYAGYCIVKHAAANGAPLWEKHLRGPANSNDYASAVAVDSSGNVVVTGSSHNGPPNNDTDYYTARYAAADGTLLWEQRYNGPANSYDDASSVAVDGDGDIVVTGVSYNASNSDFYTVKYAAGDGALLWENRYKGPANGDDCASSLALGPNGMVAVIGTSSGDYAIVVYQETLPPLSIALVPTGLRFRFTGLPGQSYRLERASTVTGLWATLATPTAPPYGLIEYVDVAPPLDAAFYRTVQP